MKKIGLMVFAVLIAAFGMAGVASAQCADALQDGLEASVTVAQIGDTIEYTVTLWIAPDGNPCTAYHTTVYFHPPPDVQAAPCVDYAGAVQLNMIPIDLSPGTLIEWTSADYPILSQPVQAAWAGGTAWAYTCTRYVPDAAGANPPVPDPTSPLWSRDSAQTHVEIPCPDPCIEITKTVNCDISKVGDWVTYEICVENCGESFDLTGVEVYDDLLGGRLVEFPGTLEPGVPVCFSYDYQILPEDDTGDDYPAATLMNQAHVVATDECSGEPLATTYSDEVFVYLVHPGLEVTKTCITPFVPVGGEAQFEIVISNTGDIELDITTDEAEIVDFQLPAGTDDTTVVTRTCEEASVHNGINVTGTIPSSYCDLPNTFERYAEDSCTCVNPCIDVTKEVDCDISKVGDWVTYEICITNCSDPDARLIDVTVVDDVLGDLSEAVYGTGGFPSELEIDEVVCLSFDYQILPEDDTGDDYPAAEHVNIVTANGTDEAGFAAPEVQATETVYLVHPGLEVTKTCITPFVPVGGEAQFEIVISNTGDIELDITTDEAEIVDFQLPAGTDDTTVVTRTCEEASVHNGINVTGTIPSSYCDLPNTFERYAEDSCTCVNPCIDVTKTVNCDISKVGDWVTYEICITNCSDPDARLIDVTVVDDVLGDLSEAVYGAGGFPSELEIDEVVCLSFDYQILPEDDTGDDYPAAEHVNIVTANGTDEAGFAAPEVQATETVYLVHPGLEVTKTCITPFVPVGGEAQFEIVISNTGDIELDITTDEAEIVDFQLPAGTDDTTVVTRTCEEASVHNGINVTGTIPSSYCDLPNTFERYAEDSCTCVNPCIDVTKTVNCDISKVGDWVTYEICITNCSDPDARLIDVTVVDDVLGDLSEAVYGAGGFPSELEIDEVVCLSFDYQILPEDDTGDDYPAAEHVNIVTANGTDEAGFAAPEVQATETVYLIHPDFTVTKVCVESPVPAGQDYGEFDITITNTGDIDLDIDTDEIEITPFTLTTADPIYERRVARDCEGDVASNTITVTATIAEAVNDCDLDNVIGPKSAGDECECPVGENGCTPGFWKNHTDCWCTRFAPTDEVGSVFSLPTELDKFDHDSLLKALKYGGGNGVAGATKNLLRSAVSAILNGCSSDVPYPMSADAVIAAVNTALATLDRDEILALHTMLDTLNNLGCSIDAHCNPIGDEPDDKLNEANTGEVVNPTDHGGRLTPTVAWSRSIPNPFRETTSISFGLPKGGAVAIDVYDVAGKHIASLLNADKSAGTHEVIWNGRSSHDTPVPAGTYFYRITLEDEVLMRKMMLIR